MTAYTKMLDDGRYEYGIVKYNWQDRKRDKMVAVGIEERYEIALKLAAAFDEVGCNHGQPHDDAPQPPYPWCRQPEICIGKGYCPRDPNCGE